MCRISIITALHNKGPYIAETIASVRDQTLADWEMIVVENGSTDDGPEQVEVLAGQDPRIHLVRAPLSVRGPGAARNLGVSHATGEWILFLDADDLIEPDYLEERLNESDDADIVAGPWHEFQDGNRENRTQRFPDGWNEKRKPIDSAFCFTPWILHAAIVRHSHLLGFGGWNETLDQLPSEDCAFWFAALQGARLAWSEHAGAIYRKGMLGSRDDMTGNEARRYLAGKANRQANERLLASFNSRLSYAQAATAFRVVRNQWQMPLTPPDLNKDMADEMRAWLAMTNPLDPRMLVWRLWFRELRLRMA